MLCRGLRVQARARRLLDGDAGHPRRVDTGDLRSSVGVREVTYGGEPAVRVGTSRQHGRWVHRGTGLYGPRHALIRPRHARVLVFRLRGGKKIFVRFTRGMRPNHFLTDALAAARGR